MNAELKLGHAHNKTHIPAKLHTNNSQQEQRSILQCVKNVNMHCRTLPFVITSCCGLGGYMIKQEKFSLDVTLLSSSDQPHKQINFCSSTSALQHWFSDFDSKVPQTSLACPSPAPVSTEFVLFTGCCFRGCYGTTGSATACHVTSGRKPTDCAYTAS